MATHLVWFRNDLRVTDNRALYAACEDLDAEVIAIFIATPQQWQQHDMSGRQANFIYQHLQQLQTSLSVLGIPLYYQQCDDFTASIEWLDTFCKQHKVDSLFYNKQYEFNERQRDLTVEKKLSASLSCYSFDDSLLLLPQSVITNEGTMYKVFTPFRRAFLQQLMAIDNRSLKVPKSRTSTRQITLFPIEPFDYPLRELDDHFPIGESIALERLRTFCREQVADYAKQRDFPAINGTSCLSAYLAIGVLSPRQCLNRLRLEQPDLFEKNDGGAFTWLSELIWREFYRHLLVAYPHLSKHKPFVAWTDAIEWWNSPENFVAWQQGKTGYPIVDAAMRQLNTTGWMHNRLRMITASFLVKDLLIDWRLGEQYFISQLIDGDLAANNGGWQWSASTGVDAAPYFRIFNPTTQGERFDPDGRFIREWLPELAEIPEKDIHQPHRWADKQGVFLDYPKPIVNHAEVRKHTLAAFEAAKRQATNYH